MPRHRLALASLVLSLLAAACGSDDGGGEALNADIFTGATTTRAQPQGSGEPDAPAGDEQQDALVEPRLTVLDSAQVTDQAVADASGEADAWSPQQLGDRFEWCADIQAIWERQVQAQAQVDVAGAAYLAAFDAYNSATDELDRAEAFQAVEATFQRYEDLRSDLEDVTYDAASVLAPGFRGTDETQSIALERAREAYSANADPIVQELWAIALSRIDIQPEPAAGPEPEPVGEVETPIELLDLDGALAVIDRHRSEVEDLVGPISSAHQAMLDGGRVIGTAEQPSDLAMGLRQVMDAAAELKELNRRLHAALSSANDAQEQHELYEREALIADEITHHEYRENTDRVRETLNALYTIAGPARDQAGRSATVNRAARADVESKALVFAVTDLGGMAAFWASLSKSCQP